MLECQLYRGFVGLRVVIYPSDHRPAYVHVTSSEAEAVFNLNCPAGPIELRESYRFSRGELSRIEEELGERLVVLCEEWSRIHGGW